MALEIDFKYPDYHRQPTIVRMFSRKKRLMKRIFLVLGTNLAVLLLLGSAIFLIERLAGVRLGRGGAGALLCFAALCGFGGALISLALAKRAAKRIMAVRVISAPRTELEAWLVATVERLAARVEIAMPEVGIFEAEEMNAFATGARRNAALVAVSTGLLQAMPRPEVEAVLGHEISHVANGDMVTLALLQGVLNTFVIFIARIVGTIVDRTLFRNDRGESGSGFILATMAAEAVLGIGAGMIVGWYSRQREFRADRGGATLAGAARMIDALELLKRSRSEALPPEMRVFGIHTGSTGGFRRLFTSHPTLDARIAALRTSNF
jgi:heat shock protein HtpX